jgi:hypothetical protein
MLDDQWVVVYFYYVLFIVFIHAFWLQAFRARSLAVRQAIVFVRWIEEWK